MWSLHTLLPPRPKDVPSGRSGVSGLFPPKQVHPAMEGHLSGWPPALYPELPRQAPGHGRLRATRGPMMKDGCA